MNIFPSASFSTLEKLQGFRDLPIGWHYGEGAPLSAEVVDEARRVCEHLLFVGFTRTNAFAGAGGEAQIAAYHREHHLSVTIEPNLSLRLEHEVNGAEIFYQEDLDLKFVKSKLRQIAVGIWSTLGSSTQRTSTKSRDISGILNLREDHQMDLACRWSNWSVPPRKVAG